TRKRRRKPSASASATAWSLRDKRPREGSGSRKGGEEASPQTASNRFRFFFPHLGGIRDGQAKDAPRLQADAQQVPPRRAVVGQDGSVQYLGLGHGDVDRPPPVQAFVLHWRTALVRSIAPPAALDPAHYHRRLRQCRKKVPDPPAEGPQQHL